MSELLNNIIKNHPPITDSNEVWDKAIVEAGRVQPERGSNDKESPKNKMRRLRESLEKELVAFHDALIIQVYDGEKLEKTFENSQLWEVTVPLTLFPKRSQGFNRVECIVEFSTEAEGNLRVLKLLPEQRSRLLAKAEMGGSLDLKTNVKLGIPTLSFDDSSVVSVAGKVYAKAEAADLVYKVSRDCVRTEIVRGTGARWRFDDVHDQQLLKAESHQLQVIIEVSQDVASIEAVGYSQAYSDTKWLSHTLGGFWKDFKGSIRALFKRGLPCQAFAEWENVFLDK